MRFGQIAKGTRARKTVPLPLGDGPMVAPHVAEDGSITFPPADGVVMVDLRPLTQGEAGDVLAQARAYAVSKGVSDPRDGNPIYDMAEVEYTLALACIDHDSPPDAPAPFFDGGVDQIRASADLGRDRLLYLYEQHQLFQDECSPSLRKLAPDDLLAAMVRLAGEDGAEAQRFFTSMGPGLRWICTRTLACLWSISLGLNSPSTSPSGGSGSSSTPTGARLA